ncbi:MAG: hypothetical protein QXO00_02595 [Candidatus Bathyarchaeia archaeon]
MGVKVVYVADDFNDDVLDLAKWDEYEYLGGIVNERNGRLECSVTTEFQMAGVSTKNKINCRNLDCQIVIGVVSGLPKTWFIMLCPHKTYTENISIARPFYRIQYSMGEGVQAVKMGARDSEPSLLKQIGVSFKNGLKLRIFSAEGKIRFYYDVGEGWKEFVSEPYTDVEDENYIYIGCSASPNNTGAGYIDNFVATEAVTPWGTVSNMLEATIPVLTGAMVILMMVELVAAIRRLI